MPDFIDKLEKEVIFDTKKRILVAIYYIIILLLLLNKKLKKKVLLKMAKTKSQPGLFLILFLKFWQISGSCLL